MAVNKEVNAVPKKKSSNILPLLRMKVLQCTMCVKYKIQIFQDGIDAKTYGATNLVIHLKTKHKELHVELEKVKDAKASRKLRKEKHKYIHPVASPL